MGEKCMICGKPTTPRGKTCSSACKGAARSLWLAAKEEERQRVASLRAEKCFKSLECRHYCQCLSGGRDFVPRAADWSCYEEPDSARSSKRAGSAPCITMAARDRSKFNAFRNFL